MRAIQVFLLLILASILSVGCASIGAVEEKNSHFSFALIGDTPYFPEDDARFDRLISEINGSADVQWVLHAGDIKSGSTPCSDAYLAGRLAKFQEFERPFILTPGDNEWTDCHREAAGGFQPLERLEKLRTLFFSSPGRSLGTPTLQIETQASQAGYEEFPENTRWEKAGVVFCAIHIVGSENAMLPFNGRTAADDEEAERRMAAALLWVKEAFEKAHQMGSPGVFLMIHANPNWDNRSATSVFAPFLDVLQAEAIRFGKPVVLAHGDSHYFRIDKPLVVKQTGKRIANFTRVETFGASDVHWLRVTVDPEDVNVFSFRQQIVK